MSLSAGQHILCYGDFTNQAPIRCPDNTHLPARPSTRLSKDIVHVPSVGTVLLKNTMSAKHKVVGDCRSEATCQPYQAALLKPGHRSAAAMSTDFQEIKSKFESLEFMDGCSIGQHHSMPPCRSQNVEAGAINVDTQDWHDIIESPDSFTTVKSLAIHQYQDYAGTKAPKVLRRLEESACHPILY
ncbi:hypothetical protein B0O80DRAFT_528191 [Mortierella sp. GBAus27b]|nr:hypothetical protein B0O80DRAFT_528191 [Mortierella sp. GBAus27b]